VEQKNLTLFPLLEKSRKRSGGAKKSNTFRKIGAKNLTLLEKSRKRSGGAKKSNTFRKIEAKYIKNYTNKMVGLAPPFQRWKRWKRWI